LIKKQDREDIRDLLGSYGEISFQVVKESANKENNQLNRAAQQSSTMYNCIMNSLRNSTKRSSWYRSMLLNFMMMVSHVGNIATISTLKTMLLSLDGAMRT
jgi:hypothetical protein